MLKGDSPGDSPTPNWDPALSAKVTTGGLRAPSPDGRRSATSYGLMGPSLLSMLHFLASMLRSLGVVIMTEKAKPQFPARQWSMFLCFTFLSWSPVQWQGYCSGNILQAHRALIYPASNLLLGRPPLLSLFPHSTWNSSVPAGMGFTISIKSSSSSPPRQISLLPPPSGTNRSHSMDWWDECRVSLDDPPYSNKTQRSLTFSTPKTSPQPERHETLYLS
jgi:hypothetical protein